MDYSLVLPKQPALEIVADRVLATLLLKRKRSQHNYAATSATWSIAPVNLAGSHHG